MDNHNSAPVPAPTERLRALAHDEWAWRLRNLPRVALQAGEVAQGHGLERMDRASRADRLAHGRAMRAALTALDPAGLDAAARIDHAVLLHQVQIQCDEAELGGELMPIDADQSFYSYLPEMWRDEALDSTEAVQRYIGRLAAIPQYFDDHVELLDEGVERGLVPPAVVLQGRDAPLAAVVALEHGAQTPFHQPLADVWARFPAMEPLALQVIEREVLPAYRRLLDHVRQRYLPHARAGTAARELPDGEAFYAARVRGFTTLSLSPRQVHEQGLAEVQRIGDDMARLQRDCGHHGSRADFIAGLRRDPQHYPRSAEELLASAAWICKRVDAALPRYFGRLPRQPFGVQPVPEAMAPYYTSGRYVPAPVGGTQPAQYWVNTLRLASRALYALPALTLHESVPGHHLQFALTAEDVDLAPYRRWDATLSAHTEGWALYAEYLGTEMGIYRTSLEAYGRASYEMWRACRLVVDTGLHQFGWNREQAQAYLLDHTALSAHEVATEVDRYIGWPGQALSYKMGELSLRALRRRMEAAAAGAGRPFDLRRFHDRVLALGPMPLPALEQAFDMVDTLPAVSA
ncbi:MAG: DUF885 domain-containing protein [Aquabacterium sp.]